MVSGGVQEISTEKLLQGAEIELPRFEKNTIVPFKLKIQSVADVAPIFEDKKGDTLNVSACLGNWVLDSSNFVEAYAGRIQGKEVFILTSAQGTYSLKALKKIRAGEQVLEANQETKLSAHDLSLITIRSGNHSWRFGLIQQAKALPVTAVKIEEETEFFKKALRYSAIGFAAFVALAWLWPKPSPDSVELVPAQFAKIVMTKTKETAAPSESAQKATSVAADAPKKVQQAAVVQAFRAKALQNAVSGLLKGGMTQLLAQSDFVAGASASNNARKMFDSRSSALQATASATGMSIDTNVKVSSIGGEGGSAGAGKVGYGKGEHAGVNGQGHSFVSMDVGASSVEEGLTKDEVGEVIHRHLSEVRYCYESAMLRTPDIEGKLIVNFTIGGPGNVKSSEVKNSTLPDPRLDDCIIRRLNTWKFPNTKGGVDVAVSYPFIFKTLGR
jgi:TonB family protein